MLISTRCIHGFMSNLIKKSWTDFNMGDICKCKHLFEIFKTRSFTNFNIGATSQERHSSVLKEESVSIFCEKITPNLQKISLGGCVVRNFHLQKLSKRCPNITDLYLHATPLQDDCVDIIVKGFFKTLEKLQLPYFINLSALHNVSFD